MKQSDDAIEDRGLHHIVHRDGKDVPDEHILQMLGLASGFAHCEDCGRGRHRVCDADEGLLWNMSPTGSGKGENRRTHEGECQAQPVGSAAVRIHSDQNGNRGAQRGNLGQCQIHENNSALHNVNAEVGVNARKRRQ